MAFSTSEASCFRRWASSLASLRSSVACGDREPPDGVDALGDMVLIGEARLTGETLLADRGDVAGDSIIEDLRGLVGSVGDLAADDKFVGDLGVNWLFNSFLWV